MLALEITDEESVQNTVQTIERESGGVDILVNNFNSKNSFGIFKPEQVARVIYEAATTPTPKTRYRRVGVLANVVPRIRQILSDRMFYGMIASQFAGK